MKSIFRLEKGDASTVLRSLCVTALVFLQACSEDVPAKIEAPIAEAVVVKEVLSPEDKLVNRVNNIVEDYQLTDLPSDCLKFEVLDKPVDTKRVVDVREKHGGACLGDPETSPRLFSIAIDESTGVIWSDAKSAAGNLEMLKKE